MCGFVGYCGPGARSDTNVVILRRMVESLRARGPDEETSHVDDDFATMFRRLAINDLRNGSQPFVSRDAGIVAVVNGEIYNHAELRARYLSGITFRSASDCEVVPHLYERLGTEFLTRLNGIFSLAIWDRRERRLVLARDRLGVKPLYYALVDEHLIFASELKALLVHPGVDRRLDWSALGHVPSVTFPFARPGSTSIPTGVVGARQLEPATVLEWDERGQRTQVYWHVRRGPLAARLPSTVEAYEELYAEYVEDAVAKQLMSDVPVGIALSGGLDSALLTVLAARHSDALEAFTLVEPSIRATGDPAAAETLAALLSIPLHKVRVDQEALSATSGLDLSMLEYSVWVLDYPMFDLELLFKRELYRCVRALRPEMKVVLLGQGADEFAGGYSSIGGGDWSAFADAEARAFRSNLMRSDGLPTALLDLLHPASITAAAEQRLDGLEPWQYLRFGDLAAFNLWHEDRNAAANGIEVRVPFLDHRIVEVLCAVPKRWHAQLFHDKAIERRFAARFLPVELTRRAKVPLYRETPGGSIVQTRQAILRRVFPQFRESYARSQAALFLDAPLCRLFEAAQVPGRGEHASSLLFHCMAIAIFERHCRAAPLPDIAPPSIAERASPWVEDGHVEDDDVRPLRDADHVSLSPGVALTLTVEHGFGVLILVDGVVAGHVPVPARCATADALMLVLGRRTWVVEELRLGLGLDLQELEGPLQSLLERGWVRRGRGP